VSNDAVKNGFVCRSAEKLELEVGNACNLKCRMCLPEFSSRVAKDPIQSSWHAPKTFGGNPSVGSDDSRDNLDFAKIGSSWINDKSLVYNELLKYPKQLKEITFKGGEPLLSKEFPGIIDFLSKNANIDDITISVVTNGTINIDPLTVALAKFKNVIVAVSFDDIGVGFEYIRFPAAWSKVFDNIKKLKQLSNVYLMSSITCQAYNVLQLDNIFRFCDEHDIRINVNSLETPDFLSAGILPSAALKVAVERLQRYLSEECREVNRSNVLTIIGELTSASSLKSDSLLRSFVQFTEALDQDRKQSLREVYPELVSYIASTQARSNSYD
jgi:MoaA/NifB/PqqE/SkfB family radical SAM enzyme